MNVNKSTNPPLPVVSVVIPCYNQAHYLAEAVQSVLAQDYPAAALEVVVVNDGSPDHTREVAAQFGGRIVYLEQENRGLSAARNTGIRAARGAYIALLDSDDVCLPGRVQTQAAYLTDHPNVGLVASDALLYDGERLLGLKSRVSGKPAKPADFRAETVSYYATPSTAMIRRTCFAEVGYFDERLRRAGEDWLFTVRLSLCYALAYQPFPTILYRVHPQSATRNLELVKAETRIAADAAMTWARFGEYPAAYRARLLYYRFATAWNAEPRREALRYFLLATHTAPLQLGYGLRVIGRALRRRLG